MKIISTFDVSMMLLERPYEVLKDIMVSQKTLVKKLLLFLTE